MYPAADAGTPSRAPENAARWGTYAANLPEQEA
jgi:hypothetical protein